jgi:hypothetical protein
MRVTQDVNPFGEIIAHAQCSVDEKKLKYIPCVPHKNNCNKRIGSYDQVEICSQQLEICKSVCMFIGLAIVVETD